tara:strand:- start:261 stop:644 length:384 start_codon:yes stop_codon:yes gene_type:complete
MGLTSTPIATQTTGAAQPDKTISIRHYGSSNDVLLYTVPVGKKFTGRCGTNAISSQAYGFTITKSGGVYNSANDPVYMFSYYFDGANYNYRHPMSEGTLNLHAGDTVRVLNNSSNLEWKILGVESDA